MVLALLAGCGRQKAQAGLEQAMAALKSQDEAKIAALFEDTSSLEDIVDASGDTTDSAETKRYAQQLVDKVTATLAYKIGTVQEDGDTASATMDITALDLKSLMQSLITQMFQLAMDNAFASSPLSDQEMGAKYDKLFADGITDASATVTTAVTVAMEYKDGQWKVKADDTFWDAVFGGLLTMAQGEAVDDDLSKLEDVDSWVSGDIWGEGFCDLASYIADGTSSTGQTMDAEFTMQQLTKAMADKPGYDSFIAGLTDEKYADVKSIYEKLSGQIDTVYGQFKGMTIKAGAGNAPDTGLFEQYMSAFEEAVMKLE